ncbi:unnamed protein product [Urochloa decumbens]|uniref:LRAT domain-containing protein n=1 Tax=Urochloa decumbens TaxID=240449 RepID=A0ABC9GW17_9POAL
MVDRGVTVLSSRIERWQLRRGDHIYSWRKDALYSYAHHGIYENDEKVIHFTNTSAGAPSSSSSSTLPYHCAEAMRKGGVVICCLDCFLEGNNLRLFVYSVPWLFFQMSNIGVQDTCSMDPEDTAETVLRRANDLFVHGFGSYDLVLQNCFDFAFYCKTGRQYVSTLELVLGPPKRLDFERESPSGRVCTIM